jgi:hypothetical protein
VSHFVKQPPIDTLRAKSHSEIACIYSHLNTGKTLALDGMLNVTLQNLQRLLLGFVAKTLNRVLALVVRLEVFTEVTMKNGIFRDVTPCGSCKNRRFGGTYRLLH